MRYTGELVSGPEAQWVALVVLVVVAVVVAVFTRGRLAYEPRSAAKAVRAAANPRMQ